MFEVGIDEKLLEELIKLAPNRELAERALAETKSVSLEAAITWLKSNSEADNMLKPSMDKLGQSGKFGVLPFASSAMQGWRSYMEDVVFIDTQVISFAP
jgi:hypothetical protein